MTRGQKPAAWQSRWRQGTCPVHGLGLREAGPDVERDGAGGTGATLACPVEGCDVRARRVAGRDRHHAFFAWVSGPDAIREALRKANDIDDAGAPTRWSREVRTGYPGLDDA